MHNAAITRNTVAKSRNANHFCAVRQRSDNKVQKIIKITGLYADAE